MSKARRYQRFDKNYEEILYVETLNSAYVLASNHKVEGRSLPGIYS